MGSDLISVPDLVVQNLEMGKSYPVTWVVEHVGDLIPDPVAQRSGIQKLLAEAQLLETDHLEKDDAQFLDDQFQENILSTYPWHEIVRIGREFQVLWALELLKNRSLVEVDDQGNVSVCSGDVVDKRSLMTIITDILTEVGRPLSREEIRCRLPGDCHYSDIYLANTLAKSKFVRSGPKQRRRYAVAGLTERYNSLTDSHLPDDDQPLSLGPPVCHYCHGEIDPTLYGTYQWMAGWGEKRIGGGQHALRGRKELPMYAHEECIDRVLGPKRRLW